MSANLNPFAPMRAKYRPKLGLLLLVVCAVVGGLGTFDCSARVLDDFNDNTKTAWTDFTFVPGFGIPFETNGQFRFELPPAGQDLVSASQKSAQIYELKDVRTLEVRAVMIH